MRPGRLGCHIKVNIPAGVLTQGEQPSDTAAIDTEILRKIGELFLLRTNINSVGSVLDSPVRVTPCAASSQYSWYSTMYTGSVLGVSPRHPRTRVSY